MAVDDVTGIGKDERTVRLVAELTANDPQFRDALPLKSVCEGVRAPDLCLTQIIDRLMNGYADRPGAGERATELVTDPESGRTTLRLLDRFETRTYRELWSQAELIARHWAAHSLRAGDFISTIGFASVDYVMLDLAAIRLGVASVPLQPGSGVAQLGAVLSETGPRLLATTPAYAAKATDLALSAESKPQVFVFDYHPAVDEEREAVEAAQRRLGEAGIGLVTLDEVLAEAPALPEVPLFVPDADDDPLALLVYTSGSTGAPKGAMYPERLMRQFWSGDLPVVEGAAMISINFMPMSHMYAKATIAGIFAVGGINYFTASSDLSTLFEDIGRCRPTQLHAVPRIYDMLFQQYQSELDRRRGEFANAEALDAAVKADIRTRFLGGRLLMTVVGSAPMSAEMKAFAEECTGIPLHDGYGTTEFGICMIDNRLQRPPILEYKLVDVPELGYFRTDKPYPRGEFVLKSSTMFPGYYRRPEVTATVFDEDGFYRTGDVMAEIGPDQLVYVDRRNNVQKLSQGEFVTVSTVESVFTASPLIRQIYVYGSSERAYLLAVIVPAESALARVASPEELRPQLVEALQETATQAGLASYEIPRDFLIETEQFSMANGLLSDIRKLLRPRLRERYGELLEQRYAELETGQEDQLRALRRDGAELPVTETIARAVQALLGRASAEVSADGRFTELGGDSLTALSFSRLLQEIFDIEVPVGVVISPATTLRSIADYVEKQRRTAGTRPAFSTVHGADTKEIRAGDLRLDKFLDQATVDAATHLPGPAAGDPKTVLLTGATGYLGRFMCIDWLERLAETGGKLVCLVRGADLDSARKRLDGTFDSGDPELLPHYRELAAGQLEVLAGDLGEPELGLDHDTWLRLASEVDVIMHPGALVNHVLPYEQLFGPNVVGTAELIRLAITGRLKPFTYLSTVGIADQIEPGTFLEAPDVRVMSPVRQRNEDYANGYSMSKWAAEVLLREAHERCGLPVTVFRSDMILTHSRYTGQLNLPDMFTRLLLSLVSTGIAPKSFYRLDAEGNRPNAHYDGLPADFSAEAVDTLGAKRNTGYRTYHLMNPHEDGISLDTYVDWLVDAGYEITRVDDYADWLRRFEAAVRALPEPRRQHSILPLLHSYQLPQEPLVTGMAPADEFRTAVQENKIGADGDIPHVTRELIVKYITDLHQLDLL